MESKSNQQNYKKFRIKIYEYNKYNFYIIEECVVYYDNFNN